jgi:20S proteasome alpha/beta subunit
MTFILGSRCKDGVVLVADKKITSINVVKSITFEYRQKIFGVLRHVLFASSGSTDTFEFFRDSVIDQVSSRTDIRIDNVLVKLSEIVLEMNRQRGFRDELLFDLLVAIQFPDDKPSTLTHISAYGTKREIDRYYTLGIGGVYTPHLLERSWHHEMTMEKAAELGYLCIKYIEDYKLHSSVGIGDGAPQIQFIPDNERDDSGEKADYEVSSETKPELFARIRKNVHKKFNRQKKGLHNLFQ